VKERIVFFAGEHCTIEWAKYDNGRVAIQLWCSEGPMARATVNVPEYEPDFDEVLVKDYSENEGMLKALIDSGIVKDTGKRVHTGYVTLPVCKLLVQPGR
jgi:hypothetical protein